MKKQSLLFLSIILTSIFVSCERDDICAASTPTTPQLILRFFNNDMRDELEVVPNLFAIGLDDNNELVTLLNLSATTSDSLVLPLRTDADQTRFLLITDSDGTATGGNIDTLTVSYDRQDVFISRACGFSNNFNAINLTITPDADNWVLDSAILRENVTDEISAHAQIFH
ncbi:hypothetical protein D7030_03785 [Flavobacteriaceae bacterium AU392]|nr:hypothetical protein D1817_10260 [Flavobacteriaceae bacterium]RKM85797.1 hypothetical protein D7030_03785 [Flavobacteriaceae bacterium AU392]